MAMGLKFILRFSGSSCLPAYPGFYRHRVYVDNEKHSTRQSCCNSYHGEEEAKLGIHGDHISIGEDEL